jgi:hypothetical protein
MLTSFLCMRQGVFSGWVLRNSLLALAHTRMRRSIVHCCWGGFGLQGNPILLLLKLWNLSGLRLGKPQGNSV